MLAPSEWLIVMHLSEQEMYFPWCQFGQTPSNKEMRMFMSTVGKQVPPISNFYGLVIFQELCPNELWMELFFHISC